MRCMRRIRCREMDCIWWHLIAYGWQRVAKGGIWCRGAEVQKADCIDCGWIVMGCDGL